jgi:hypothetical protein
MFCPSIKIRQSEWPETWKTCPEKYDMIPEGNRIFAPEACLPLPHKNDRGETILLFSRRYNTILLSEAMISMNRRSLAIAASLNR